MINDTVIDDINKKFGKFSFWIVVLLIPVYEELTFRLYLGLQRSFIAVSSALLCYGLTGPVWPSGDFTSTIFLRISFSIIVFLSLFFFLPANLIKKLKEEYFKYVFYFSALVFGLVHISNYAPLNPQLFYFYPFLVLPQIGMGLAFGYIRIKLENGLIWAVLLHGLINSVGFFFQSASSS